MAPPKQTTGSVIVRFYDPDIQAKDALGRTHEQILAWNNIQLENSHNYIQMLFPLPEGSLYNFTAPVIDLETMKVFRERSELRQRLSRSFERMLNFYGFTILIHPDEEQKGGETTKVNDQDQEPTVPAPTATKDTTVQTSKIDTPDVSSSPAATESAIATGDAKVSTATETTLAEAEASKPKSRPQASSFGYHVVRGSNWSKASRNWCVRIDHNHLRITRILRCLRVLGLQKECDAFFAALELVYNDPNISIGDRTMTYWTRAVKRPLYLAPDDDEIEWLKKWEAEQGNEQ